MNVLIVDDEPIIRQVLRTMVDWEAEGLTWYGEAEDGLEAWETIRTGAVDIVVTDILMPRMDGLELVRKLQCEQLRIAVVVLSCLDDFQYVKEAMKLGARDYVLKPTMEPDSLAEVLREAKTALARERTEAGELSRIRVQLEQSRQTQTGAAIRKWLEAEEAEADETAMRLYSDRGGRIHYYSSFTFHIASGFVWTSGDFSSPDAFAVIPWGERHATLIFEEREDAGDDSAEKTVECLKRLAEQRCEGHGTACFVSAIRGICGLDGLKAALQRHRQERECYFYGSEREFAGGGDGALPQAEKHNLLRALAGANEEAVRHWLGEIGRRIQSGRPDPESVYAFLQELLSLSAVFALQQNEQLDLSEFGKTYLAPEALRRHLQLAGLLDETVSAISRLMELQRGGGVPWMESRNPFIRQAYDYMQTHYHLPISTTNIAEHVKLSRSYISDLFSKETGESLSEALTRIRMEAAKRLLRSGNRKVYEIAESVGFHDAKAFAKTFKRMVGCSPKEYAEQ